MYFPYLRGKQEELLALREVVEIISERIIPIVEPVKNSSTFKKCIELFTLHKKKIAVVFNPKVGDFEDELDNLSYENQLDFIKDLYSNPYVIPVIIVDSELENILTTLQSFGKSVKDIIVVHTERDFIDLYDDVFQLEQPMFTLIPNRHTFFSRRMNAVIFKDVFNKRIRNQDYAQRADEFFSEWHKLYQEEGFVGFSDYSIVGRDFTSGFLPYAVAIHIVYQNNEVLRVRHYVSDSNLDSSGQSQKKLEALTKLDADYDFHVHTIGIENFRNLSIHGLNTSLGTIKRYSIMHHIELINQIL